jgi:hypothetical protein
LEFSRCVLTFARIATTKTALALCGTVGEEREAAAAAAAAALGGNRECVPLGVFVA